VTISVARDTSDLNHTLQRLGWLLFSVSLAAALLSVFILFVVIVFSLKPFEALSAQISRIDASNVSDSGALTCSIKELDPVVNRLNELLERLDKAFEHEKAFTADVAHELRTPLAGLSSAMEVCTSRYRDEASYREVISKCLDTTHAMQSMVENLLAFARAESGHLPLQIGSLDLLRFVADCWRPFEDHADRRRLRVEWPHDLQPIVVETDREQLRLVLCNLFDNAVRHSDQGGTVTIEAARDTKEAVLALRNTGCKVPPEDVEKVFARFWKHDAARTEGPRHCGIGLPLCRRIVDALGGSIGAAVSGGSFTVTLRLPIETSSKA
jgi:signal transduction histidine kinase